MVALARPPPPAFAVRQDEMRPDPHRPRDTCTRFAADQPIEPSSQFAFTGVGELLNQAFAITSPRTRSPDEPEPLIVALLRLAAAHAGMRQRNLDELLVLKSMPERLLEFLVVARTQDHEMIHLQRRRQCQEAPALGGREMLADQLEETVPANVERPRPGAIPAESVGLVDGRGEKIISARPMRLSNGT